MHFPRLLSALLAIVFGAGASAAAGAAGSSLHLACNDFPPHKIEHPGNDGLAGFDVDIVTEVLKRAGHGVEISFMPWKRALEMTERGDYDGLCSCSYTKQREAKLLFSKELGAVSVGLFSLSEAALAGTGSLVDLKGRKVVTVGGYNLEAELVTAGAAVETTSSDKGALDMLLGGNVDLLYGYELTIRHFIDADRRSTTIAFKQIGRNPYYFCLSRLTPGADATMGDVNHGLDSMAQDGSIQRILDRYHVTFH